MNINKILMLTIILVIFVMFTGTVSAANWTVNSGENIQSTIDEASSTDTIIVDDNNETAYTYNENIVINKNISLKSRGTVTIQAADSNNNVITITGEGSGATIQGFSITGGYGGIYLDSASGCTLTNNDISNNYGIGLDLENSSNNTISDNSISNNWYGIYSYYSPNNTIFDNDITDNWAYGLYFDSSSENTLLNNVIEDNWYQNLEVSGSDVSDYMQYIDTSNTINGDHIYYLIGQNNLVLDGISIGYLALISCNNIQISLQKYHSHHKM